MLRFLFNMKTCFSFFIAIFYSLCSVFNAAAASQITFIRDAEVEHTIRTFSTPIFESAQLNPDTVRLYIIDNKSLNAFVAGGQKMFFHTGLLMHSEDPLALVGVIAHEAGHIAGGHLFRTREELRNAAALQIASLFLGIGAAAAGAGGGVATGIIAGGEGLAASTFLKYSRTQESAADHAGLSYLRDNGLSATGLEKVLKKLQGQEMLTGASQNPYVRTHPIHRDRLAAVRDHIESEASDVQYPDEWNELHQRMLAKLRGFLWSPTRVDRHYPQSDTSFAAQYARAISFYRDGDDRSAREGIQDLLTQKPDDPYLYEFLGQMEFELGNFEQSANHYQKAADLATDSHLILTALGEALVVLNQEGRSEEAEDILKQSLRVEPDQPKAWHNLAILFGRQGKYGESSLAAAERFYRLNDLTKADRQIKRALDQLPEGSPDHFRALDISHAIATAKGQSE